MSSSEDSDASESDSEIDLFPLPDSSGRPELPFWWWKISLRYKVAAAFGRGQEGHDWIAEVEDPRTTFESIQNTGLLYDHGRYPISTEVHRVKRLRVIPLPEFEHFYSWKFALRQQIVATSRAGQAAFDWLRQVEDSFRAYACLFLFGESRIAGKH